MDNVFRIADFERKPKLHNTEEPVEATVIILPMIRGFNAPAPEPTSHRHLDEFMDTYFL
jgi:hypothetical protein